MGLAAALQAKAVGAKVITRSETITTALTDIAQVDHLVLLAGSFVGGKVREAEVDYLHKAFDERLWGRCMRSGRWAISCRRTGRSPSSPARWRTARPPRAPQCWPQRLPRWKRWRAG